MKRIRQWIAECREKKFCKFDDLNRIADRCAQRYAHLFPKYTQTRRGSAVIHHFNVEGVGPISLEKEHGSREFVPKHYVKLALLNIEAVADHIEANNKEGTSDDKSGDGN